MAQTVINPGPTIAQKAAELNRSIVASATTKPAPALLSPPKSVLVPSPSSPPSNLQKFVHVTQNVINATPILTQKAAETARNFAASAAPSFPSLPMPAPASQTQQVNPGKESQEASIERLQRHIQRLIAERKAQSQNGEAPKAIPPPSQPHTTAAALHRAVQIGNTLIATPNPLTRAIETGKELFKNSSPNTTPTTPQAANEKPISPPKPPVSTGNSFVDYHSGLFRGAKRASQEHAKEFLPNVVNTVELAVALHQNPLGQVLKTAQATHELISVLKDANSSEVLKSLAPELSKLVFENEKLSDAEKGELTGYIILKYVPYVIPLGAAAKAPTVAQRVTAVTAEVRSALKLAEEIEKSRKVVQAAKTAEVVVKEAKLAAQVANTVEKAAVEARAGSAVSQALAEEVKVASQPAQVADKAQQLTSKSKAVAKTISAAATTKTETRAAAHNRALHEKHKTLLRAEMEKPQVVDPMLQKVIDKIYRLNAEVGNGSTAAAIRLEKMTGEPVKGKWHLQKGEESVQNLEKWLKNNPSATPGDRAAAENILKDLRDALESE